jgi:hypothetical protein
MLWEWLWLVEAPLSNTTVDHLLGETGAKLIDHNTEVTWYIAGILFPPHSFSQNFACLFSQQSVPYEAFNPT